MKTNHFPVGLTALAIIAGMAAQPAYSQVSRTPWQMHHGQAVIKLDARLPSNAALPENGYIAFQNAQIPAEGAGWVAPPNPEIIGFGSSKASKLSAADCGMAVDYTYFQTFVDVPSGTRVDEFKIAFQGMDDASRITIFNSTYPAGQVVEGSYVTRASTGNASATMDLHALVATGKNRIVITQVDWCATGNQLQSAQVQLNGSAVAAKIVVVPGPFVPTSHGDVHIRTMDGLSYDFQAAGDFVLFQSTNGEAVVQSRQEMWEQNPKVSVNRAGAMRVMSDTIQLYLLPTKAFYVNGQLTDLPTARMTLPGGGVIEPMQSGSKSMLMVYWPNNSLVARMVWYSNNTMDVEVRRDLPAQRTYEGLIGNLDGNRANDLHVRGGAVLDPKPTNDSIALVGESWRVRGNESLFTRAHPAPTGVAVQNQPGIADLDADARRAANEACKAGGISDATALRHCIYDVAATGDKTFVQSAQQFQQTVAALPASERSGEKVEPAHVQVPPAAAAAPSGRSAGLLLPGENLARRARYSMSGHYLVFQEDGNLCVYKTAGDQWVWCINNDAGVQYQRAASAQMTKDGRLILTDEGGGIVWQAPANNPQAGTGVHLTDAGALELRTSAGDVVWSSR